MINAFDLGKMDPDNLLIFEVDVIVWNAAQP